jgi:hypothetical protein
VIKRLGFAFLLAVFVFTIAGCAKLFPGIDEMDPYMDTFIDAIETGQYDTFVQACADEWDMDELYGIIEQVRGYMQGSVTGYKRINYKFNTRVSGDMSYTTRSAQYLVDTDVDRYLVTMTVASEGNGPFEIYSFYVSDSADVKAAQGRIIDFQHIDALQVIPLLLTIASIGLIVASVVLSAKAEIRNKALWILISLLGTGGLILTHTPISFHIQFSAVVTLPLSYCMKYPDGSVMLQIMFPVGAVVFMLLRKHLIEKRAAYDARQKYAAVSRELPPGENIPE